MCAEKVLAGNFFTFHVIINRLSVASLLRLQQTTSASTCLPANGTNKRRFVTPRDVTSTFNTSFLIPILSTLDVSDKQF